MFGLGMQELILIGIIALVVIGPKRLPTVAKSLGKGYAEFRKAMNDLKSSVDLSDDEPKEKKSNLKDMYDEKFKNKVVTMDDVDNFIGEDEMDDGYDTEPIARKRKKKKTEENIDKKEDKEADA